MKIFGREPTAWLQLFTAVMAVVVAFGFDGLSADQATLLTAFVTAGFGAMNAFSVRPVAPTVFTTVITTGAALLAGYGLDLSQEMVGSVTAAVVAAMALATRAQVSPVGEEHKTGVTGARMTTE